MDDGQPSAFPGRARGALSVTFDDGRPSQLDVAVPILDRHGLRGTFYVVPARIAERAAEWRRVAERHEIGGHSGRHPVPAGRHGPTDDTLDRFTLDRMEAELVQADHEVERLLGVRPRTFAYPGGYTHVGEGVSTTSYVPVVARRYLAGRGYRSEFANHPEWCDLAHLDAAHVDGFGGDALGDLVDRAAADGRWLIVVAHDIDGAGSWSLSSKALDRLCAHAAGLRDLWVAPVVDVAQHLRARRGRPRSPHDPPLEG